MQPVDFEAVPNLNLGVVVMNQAPEGARVPGDAAGSDGAGGGGDGGRRRVERSRVGWGREG